MQKLILIATAISLFGLSATAHAGPYVEVDVDDVVVSDGTKTGK